MKATATPTTAAAISNPAATRPAAAVTTVKPELVFDAPPFPVPVTAGVVLVTIPAGVEALYGGGTGVVTGQTVVVTFPTGQDVTSGGHEVMVYVEVV